MARFVKSEMERIRKVDIFWDKNPTYALKGAASTDLSARVIDVDSAVKAAEAARQKAREAAKQRDEAFTKARDLAFRLGRAVVADDPDSPDVKELGFVPRSERKHPTHKPKAG